MLLHFARLCQILGLVMLPIGLYIGMARGDSRTELMLLVLGAGLFISGHLLGRSGGKET